jgi:hypothetical protein
MIIVTVGLAAGDPGSNKRSHWLPVVSTVPEGDSKGLRNDV